MSFQEKEIKKTAENDVKTGKKNMIINKLPTKTWNHLKMNETFIEGMEVPFAKTYEEKIGKNTGINYNNELHFHLADKNEKKLFGSIETALGKDMDDLGEELPVLVIDSSNVNDETDSSKKDDPEKKIVKNTAILNLTSDGRYGRYFLYARANSRTNIAVYCTSKENEEGPFLFQLKIYAEENAAVDLSVVQIIGKNIKVFSDLGGVLEKNATVNLVKMELGGSKVYSGAYMDLKGDTSSFKAHIGYLGEENQRLDMNYVARHHGKKTESLMESSGVLSGNAFKLFRGTIDFIKGCPGSVGNEKEDVLLLGDDVINQTIPLILCAEEDVEGNHGASIGELDEKTLFYLMSRGFSQEAAQEMIARARLDAVAEQILEPSVREKTLKFLEERQ